MWLAVSMICFMLPYADQAVIDVACKRCYPSPVFVCHVALDLITVLFFLCKLRSLIQKINFADRGTLSCHYLR